MTTAQPDDDLQRLLSKAADRARSARAARAERRSVAAAEVFAQNTILPEDQEALRSSIGMLPELTPAKPKKSINTGAALAKVGIRLSRGSAQDEVTDFREREDASDPIAKLTVYALNAMILLFAFPVGFALLIFNILGGENLRTTAHAMALTGMGIALGWTELGQQILSSVAV